MKYLSVAGRREGLSGERSSLFMEQIRVIKEMRGATNGKYPRFMVWENVQGAFSSGKDENGNKLPGEDFRIVLEETAKIADPDAVIPRPPKKWTHSGCIVGDGWSIAWRLHDAQFWGVPQRRKRICLLADFCGESAGKILFELQRKADVGECHEAFIYSGEGCRPEVQAVSKGLQGNTEKGGSSRERTAADFEGSTGETGDGCLSYTLKGKRAGKGALVQKELSRTLGVSQDQTLIVFEPGAASRVGGHIYEDGVTGTIRADAGDNQQAVVYGADMYNGNLTEDIMATLTASSGSSSTHSGPSVVCLEGNGSRPSHKGDGYKESEIMYTLNATEQHAVVIENHPNDSRVKIAEDGVFQTLSGRMGTGGGNVPMVMALARHVTPKVDIDGVGFTLNSRDYKDPQCVVYCSTTGSYMRVEEEIAQTLMARDFKDPQIVSYGFGKENNITIGNECAVSVNASGVSYVSNYIVRRLTPMECERLQGFPDNWTNIGEWVDSKGKVHKDADSPRYKALGNSIALPFWGWLAERMMKVLNVDHPTMASLFDGIGGFPLVFSRVGCAPVWISEIEEFPLAVTKERFGYD